MNGEQVRLGGIATSRFGLGSWNTWDRMDFDDAVSLIRTAVDNGVTLFDVAHYDMGPHSEGSSTDVIFGQAVKAAGIPRDDYQLCGKLWLWDYPRTGFAHQLDTALTRIGVDKADIVVVGDYFESPDIPRIVTEVAEQIRANRFQGWGVNNWAAADLDKALTFATTEGLPTPTFAQLKYSIVRRSMAEGPHYGNHFTSGRLTLQASDIFEGGILLGNKTPTRKIGADPGGIRDSVKAAADTLTQIAKDFGATRSQLAIAFCLSYEPVANVLFGVSKLGQLMDNLGALRLWAEHGPEIRAAVDNLWLDRAVNPDGTW
ncbi:aldo/keto reductase [Actinocrispum wychmicini]|uniref:Aryl-alcohol dehydrogenase-like predicted oxidoreductase n=1 Tax=Actinocrispum wychmicini TaxID=1213861 RepID=A0A4V2S7H2_9PSEU|nr:aldo/keto reductase [Actinocrispum wychmicini]TCO59870.1 aryl-alcohol dehydrogenase-like predicted oxidoreductase [Actinocrispum wychmicini]